MGNIYNWSPIGGSGSGSGLTTYTNLASFPVSAADGTAAIALDTSLLYVYSVASTAWILQSAYILTTAKGAVNGVASLDSSGLIPIAQIPPAAIERMVVVADQAARYALTTATVQNGDTVYQTDTTTMYFVIDQTNLGNSSGYKVYSAGTSTVAQTVPTVATTTNQSYYLSLFSASTNSNQALYLSSSLSFNPSTNVLSATTFSGALSGNATSATNATNVATTTKADAVAYYLAFVSANSTSNQGINVGPMTYNPSTGTLTATTFAGNASTATTATNATNVAATTKADNTTYYPTFLAANSSSNQGINVGPMTYNPSTGTLTSTTFVGALTGHASSDIANTLTTTTGDMIYASSANTPARLAKGTQYQTLQGGATVPTWGAVNLGQATAITGTLPVASGGTGQTTIQTALAALATWTASATYAVGQAVVYGGDVFVCRVAHTASSSIATDIALGKWVYGSVNSFSNPNLMLSGDNFEDNTAGGWTSVNAAPLTNGLPLIASIGGAVYQTGQYIFTITSGNATAAATYTNNTKTFTVVTTIAAGTVLVCTGTGAPTASGTLTKSGGTGDATITFSAVTSTAAGGNTTAPAVTSSGVLDGTYSLNLATSGAGTIGDGYISQSIPISLAYQAKVLTLKFKYKSASGAPVMAGTSANTYAAAVYDVTNNAWLGLAGAFNFVQSSGVGDFVGTFQTASTTAAVQVFVYSPVAPVGASSLLLDNFYLGPQASASGPAMSDWVAYTPTGTWTTNTTYTGYWRRVGDTLSLRISIAIAGAPTSATLYVNLPTGMTIDTSKAFTADTIGAMLYQSAATGLEGAVRLNNGNSTTAIQPIQANGGAITQASPGTFANNDFLRFEANGIPITGWSSNSVSSADSDTRVVAMQVASVPTGTITASASLMTFGSGVVNDTHSGFSTSTGKYTISVTGYYRVSLSVNVAATYANTNQTYIGVGKNSVSAFTYQSQQVAGAAEGNLIPNGSWTVFCNAGDYLAPLVASTGTTPTFAGGTVNDYFMVERLSGPAVVAASESVSALYTGAPPTGSIGAAYNTVTYGTKVKDSHSAYSSGSYTIPVSGTYSIAASLGMTGTYALNNIAATTVHVDGVQAETNIVYAPSAVTSLIIPVTVFSKPLLAGQIITIRSYNNGTGPAYSSTATQNYFSIARTGNY